MIVDDFIREGSTEAEAIERMEWSFGDRVTDSTRTREEIEEERVAMMNNQVLDAMAALGLDV